MEKRVYSAEEIQSFTKEQKEEFLKSITSETDDLTVKYTDEKDVPSEVLNWTPEQVKAYLKSRERYSKY